jgi:hypothetical protein
MAIYYYYYSFIHVLLHPQQTKAHRKVFARHPGIFQEELSATLEFKSEALLRGPNFYISCRVDWQIFTRV